MSEHEPTEPTETLVEADHADPASPPDPSNSPITELVEPLDADDDIYHLIGDTEAPADAPPEAPAAP